MNELFGTIEEQIQAIRTWALVMEIAIVLIGIIVLALGIVVTALLNGILGRLDRLISLQSNVRSPLPYGGPPPTGTPVNPAQYGPLPRYGPHLP